MNTKSATIVASVWLFCGIALAATGAPPSANFDLSHWKLTLPIDDAGGLTGEAVEIKTPQLLAGYTSTYFYMDTDGAMVFWCPVVGAKTKSASYPRSELRELLDSGDASVNWTAYGTHILAARCKVTQLPSAGKMILGQVHGDDSSPVVKVQINNGKVEGVVKSNIALDTDVRFTYANIGLNTVIDYEIKVVDGVAFITVNGVTYSHDFFTSDPAWKTQSFYFKAGAYLQDNAGPDTEGGRVSFYQLAASHPAIAPVRFVNAGMTNRHFRAELIGVAGTSYVIQGSSNQVNWVSLATNISPTGISTFVDPSLAGRSRFYRAR